MEFPLSLTENNARNLINGKSTQLKNKQLHDNSHKLVLHPMNHAKLTTAKNKNKGVRLGPLTKEEIEATAEGFGDIWRKIKSGAQKVASVAKTVVQSEPYQTLVKPIVKRAVSAAVAAATPALSSIVAPETIQKGVDYVGKETGAFGLKPPAKKGRKKVVGGSFLIQ